MPSVLDLLTEHEVRRFGPGEIVIEQGDCCGILFFLIEGTVEVIMGEAPVCTAGRPGTVFGEVSALIGRKHVATVRTLTPCAFYAVKNPRAFLSATPAACLHVCEALAHRINGLSQYLADVKEQYDGHDHIGMVSEVLEALMYREPRTHARPEQSAARHGQLTD